MNTLTDQEVVAIAREFLINRGLELKDLQAVMKVDGAVRKLYLPDEDPNDYWLVRFGISVKITPEETQDLSEDEAELYVTIAMESDSVVVEVRIDRSARLA